MQRLAFPEGIQIKDGFAFFIWISSGKAGAYVPASAVLPK